MSLLQHAFGQVIERVFDRGDEELLTLDQEREHIRAVRDEASDESWSALVLGYARLLRNAARRNERFGKEQAREAAIDALNEVVFSFDFDTEDRLAKRLPGVIKKRMDIAGENMRVIRLPHETERRYYRIWNLAGQDVNTAVALAPSEGMERETFLAVYAVKTFAPTMPEDGHSSIYVSPKDEHTDADTDFYVEQAEELATPDEWTVLRFAYGFVTGDPMTDGEVAQAWSEDLYGVERVSNGEYHASRAKVQRLRVNALARIREALGIEVEQ